MPVVLLKMHKHNFLFLPLPVKCGRKHVRLVNDFASVVSPVSPTEWETKIRKRYFLKKLVPSTYFDGVS